MDDAKQPVLFEDRFLESYAGSHILKEPRTAIIELIANAWDAGATQVYVNWPDSKSKSLSNRFEVIDNGHGMSRKDFETRWLTLAYDRLQHQGNTTPVVGSKSNTLRKTFGRNGVGRFAGFCFGETYHVQTWRNKKLCHFTVKRGLTQPLEIDLISEVDDLGENSGTVIYAENPKHFNIPIDYIRHEISTRFLIDPDFEVILNNRPISFADIPSNYIEEIEVEVEGDVSIIRVIDVKSPDRTTQQHGIAWHVNRRLVGNCSWEIVKGHEILDGRRAAAKRFTFIIRADHLVDCVDKDWSGFIRNEKFERNLKPIAEEIRKFLNQHSVEDRQNNIAQARAASRTSLEKIGPLRREIWDEFLDNAQKDCPSLTQRDIVQLGVVLANLEESHSQYSLIHQLSELSSNELDDANTILEEWSLSMAKIVLDELKTRFTLINEMRQKISNPETLELQDLQPLFERGLWIFGPEFESIHYTSNRGMTTVIQMLNPDCNEKGTLKRPDFAILPDSTVGLYSCDAYDTEGGENGIASLVIVELKKPSVRITDSQKRQAWGYVKELLERGQIQDNTKVRCLVLGREVSKFDAKASREGDNIEIIPMLFDRVIGRAESRLFNLEKKIKNAPFLENRQEEISEFLGLNLQEKNLFTSVERPVVS